MYDNPSPQPTNESPPATSSTSQLTGITDNDRLMAALAYFLWFLGSAIILLSPDMKERPYLRYHAVQALGSSIVLAVASVILMVLGVVVCCLWILLLVPFGASVYLAYLAYQGKYFTIPVLTNVMKSEGWLKDA